MPTLNGNASLAGLGLISCNPLPAPFLLGSAVTSSGTSLTITVGGAVGVGDSVLVLTSSGTAARQVTGVTDSAGNASTAATIWDGDTNANGPASLGYTANIALPVNGTITVNFTGAASAHLASAYRFSGIALKVDTDPVSSNTTSTSWTTSDATGVMGSTPDYVMPMINFGTDPSTVTIGAGFTLLASVAGAALHQTVAYKLTYTTTTVTCSGFSWVNSVVRNARAFSYRSLAVTSGALSGVGVISTPAVQWMLGTAECDGSGAISCNANPPCQFGIAECDGVGTISASAVEWMLGTTELDGVGAINVPAVERMLGTVTLAGVGAINVSAVEWMLGTTTLAGVGAINCNANPPCQFGSAECDGVGAINATAVEWMLGTTALAGSGVISCNANPPCQFGAAECDGSGTVSCDSVHTPLGSVTLAGVGAIAAPAVEWMLGTTELDGIGVVSCPANPPCQFGAGECDGVGAIGVSAVERMLATTSLNASGSVVVPACQIWRTNPATLGGVGAISCDSHLAGQGTVWTGSATLAGIGAINAPGVELALGTAALAAGGSVSLDISHTPAATSALGGFGGLGASGLALAAGSAGLASSGLVSGTAVMWAIAGADLSPDSVCTADALSTAKPPPEFGSQNPAPGPQITPPWPDEQAIRPPRWPDGTRRFVAIFPNNDAPPPAFPVRRGTVKTSWPDEAA